MGMFRPRRNDETLAAYDAAFQSWRNINKQWDGTRPPQPERPTATSVIAGLKDQEDRADRMVGLKPSCIIIDDCLSMSSDCAVAMGKKLAADTDKKILGELHFAANFVHSLPGYDWAPAARAHAKALGLDPDKFIKPDTLTSNFTYEFTPYTETPVTNATDIVATFNPNNNKTNTFVRMTGADETVEAFETRVQREVAKLAASTGGDVYILRVTQTACVPLSVTDIVDELD